VTSTVVEPGEAAPPPVAPRPRLPHHPGLDGVRGAAVAAVLLFHGGFSWAKGGYLGVSTFFTLSGFLITGLLLGEWQRNGNVVLGRFWERRFRRLLPALLVAVLGVALFAAAIADADQRTGIRDDALATLGYVANWRFVFSGQDYADLFDAPSPLLHAWSLAIEEQFYVLFPLLVVVLLRLGRGRRTLLTGVLGTACVASVVAAVVLYGDGNDSRVYYGTDTRAAELLTGALLAIWVAGRGADLHVRARTGVAVAGAVALAASIVAWVVVDQSEPWLYRGGLGLYALGTTALVAAAVAPGPVRSILSARPLRFLGAISYGVYLYHWPVFLWLTPARTDLSVWPLFALRLVVTFAISLVSYRLVEMPIRAGRLPGRRALLALPVAVGVTVVAVLVTTVAPPAPDRLAAEEPAPPVPTTSPATSLPTPDEPPAPEGLPFVRDATPDDPLRVLLVGDSLAFDAEPGIRAALEATGEVVTRGANVAGFGLLQPYDWRREWPVLLAEVEPELVIAMWGGWDEPYLEEEGLAAYENLLDEAIDVLTSTGARVLFVGIPEGVDREGTSFPRETLTAHRDLPSRHPGVVQFLDSDPVISPEGEFTSHLEGPTGPERVRKRDGVHICPAGSARFGRAIVDAVTPAWRLAPPDPAWRAGDWALDPRFDDPPGTCAP
jgi:peptidoglycan/LPS O-acetylase OafA/YrhL